MKAIDVIIFYEHVSRELDVACAIKAIAERHFGLQVELEHWPSGFSHALRSYRPKIVCMPSAVSMTDWAPLLYDWRKVIYFNLAWEQHLSRGTVKRKMPQDEFVIKHVLHHAWSDTWADFLKTVGVPERHIFVNGNPAYKLYEAPYNRFFNGRAELAEKYRLDGGKKWIFFPENFGYAFIPDHQVKTDWLERGINLEEAETMRRVARHSLEETMKWCASIALDHSVELIVRPRPAVPLDDFRNAVRKAVGELPAGMHIIKEESIREWIMASEVVISFYSTSLIEASLAGKPSLMLEPYPMPELLHVEWHQHVDRVTTGDQLRRICLDRNAPLNGNGLGVWARRGMLAHGDPIRNIADCLSAICRGEVQAPSAPPRSLIVGELNGVASSLPPLRRLLRRGVHGLPWLLFEYRKIRYRESRRNAPGLVLKIHENDLLSEEELREWAERWKRYLEGAGSQSSHRTVSLKQGVRPGEGTAPAGGCSPSTTGR